MAFFAYPWMFGTRYLRQTSLDIHRWWTGKVDIGLMAVGFMKWVLFTCMVEL
jgi:hypothetical protein